MKELKPPKKLTALYVMAGVLLAIGIVLLVLPDDVYYATGDSMPEVGRYVWFVLFALFALVTLIRTLLLIPKQKQYNKLIEEYNALRRQCGENAFFVGGYCKAINKDNSDAIRTTVSVLGAAASALLFGVGVYKIYSTDKTRLFLITDEGLYVICSQTGEKLFIKKGSITTATLVENSKGQVELSCPNENFVLTFDTAKIDMNNDELAQKLQELFFSDVTANTEA